MAGHLHGGRDGEREMRWWGEVADKKREEEKMRACVWQRERERAAGGKKER